MDLILEKTNAQNPQFRKLIDSLNEEQATRNGDKNDFYMQFNQLDDIEHVILAKTEDQYIGCGALRAFGDEAYEIKRMYTIPQFRKQGVAKQILKELEDWTVALGKSKCVLETGTMNPEALELYTNQGYSPIKNYGPYVHDEHSRCFEKEVKR